MKSSKFPHFNISGPGGSVKKTFAVFPVWCNDIQSFIWMKWCWKITYTYGWGVIDIFYKIEPTENNYKSVLCYDP